MACILCIETSTDVCSVAVCHDLSSAFERTDKNGPRHASVLGGFVDEAISFIDNNHLNMDAVAVGIGPGSYTGLRIGLSMAKGICYGRNAKLIGIPTLELMCVPVLLHADLEEDALLCPMIDARRMEVYAAIYNRKLNCCRKTQADIVDENPYDEFLSQPLYFFGNGADKCRQVIRHDNAHFIDDIQPLAQNMVPLAERKLRDGEFDDVAYLVPSYLKEAAVGKPKSLAK